MLLIILASAAIAAGFVTVARYTRQPEGMKRLLAAPQLRIADAGDAADVRIEGVVEVLEHTLRAPLTGEPCVYAELVVRAGNDVGPGGGFGPIVHEERQGVPFVVRDASGYTIVDPDGAETALEVDHQQQDRDMVRHLGVGRGYGAGGGAHQQERRIAPGDTIVVIGRGVREPDPDPSRVGGTYRDGPATRLRLSTSHRFRLHLLDPSRAPK